MHLFDSKKKMYSIFVIITFILKCLFISTFDILPAARVDLH